MPSIWLNHLLRHLKPQQQCHLPHRGGHGGTRGRVEAHHAGLNTVTTVTARHVIQQSLAATLMGSSDLTPLHSNTNDLAEAGGKLVEQAVQCRREFSKTLEPNLAKWKSVVQQLSKSSECHVLTFTVKCCREASAMTHTLAFSQAARQLLKHLVSMVSVKV